MRSKLIAVLGALAMLLVACSSSSSSPEPVVTETVTETASPSDAPSPSSGPWVVGDCTIEAGTDCRKDDLHDADLRGAQLERANLSDANFSGALLHRANLRHSNLHRTDLSEANLSSAKLENADLSKANLDHANLSYANMKGATVTGLSMENAYLCGTIMSDGSTDSSSCQTPSPAPSPSPHASKVSITEFDMQATYHCKAGGEPFNTGVKAFYATKNADKVKFTDVDVEVNAPPKKTSGSVVLNFECPNKDKGKGYSQTYTMTAIGSDGTSVTAEATVTAKFKD